MFQPSKAKNVKEYLAMVPKERKEMILALHAFIQEAAPKLKPYFAYNMVGYGTFPYRNHKGEMIKWPIVALANQKQYVSVYVCALDKGEYLAEKYKKDLGKVSVGKSCIRFKKLDDVYLPTLRKVIQQAAQKPGLK